MRRTVADFRSAPATPVPGPSAPPAPSDDSPAPVVTLSGPAVSYVRSEVAAQTSPPPPQPLVARALRHVTRAARAARGGVAAWWTNARRGAVVAGRFGFAAGVAYWLLAVPLMKAVTTPVARNRYP
eukprot:m51a1_g11798 putative C-tail anchored protein (126) ;mRNA; f:325801-326178